MDSINPIFGMSFDIGPKIPTSNVDKALKPKFEVFQEHSFSKSDLALIASANPSMLQQGLDSTIPPAIQILRELLGNETNDNVDAIAIVKKMKGLKYGPFSAVANFLLPNVALLQNYGIPLELIRKHLVAGPDDFVRSTKSFLDVLIRVETKLGIPRGLGMFFYGVHLLTSNCERTIESKCNLFKSFGCTQSDIFEMLRRNPNCFWLSEARIKKSLNFLVKELGYEPQCVIPCTFLLTCSLESRLVPRRRILMILKEKGLIRKDIAFPSAVKLSKSNFLKRFVLPFNEVHQSCVELAGCPVGTGSC